jgi:hypothetical protein
MSSPAFVSRFSGNRLDTAYHEAGRAVVARALGWDIEEISIIPDDVTGDYVQFASTSRTVSQNDLATRLASAIIVLAGYQAENKNRITLKMDAHENYEQINAEDELGHVVLDEELIPFCLAESYSATDAILDANWQIVEIAATELLFRDILDRDFAKEATDGVTSASLWLEKLIGFVDSANQNWQKFSDGTHITAAVRMSGGAFVNYKIEESDYHLAITTALNVLREHTGFSSTDYLRRILGCVWDPCVRAEVGEIDLLDAAYCELVFRLILGRASYGRPVTHRQSSALADISYDLLNGGHRNRL